MAVATKKKLFKCCCTPGVRCGMCCYPMVAPMLVRVFKTPMNFQNNGNQSAQCQTIMADGYDRTGIYDFRGCMPTPPDPMYTCGMGLMPWCHSLANKVFKWERRKDDPSSPSDPGGGSHCQVLPRAIYQCCIPQLEPNEVFRIEIPVQSDAWIDENDADHNFGFTEALALGKYGPGSGKRIVSEFGNLRFNPGGPIVPPEATIVHARLERTVMSSAAVDLDWIIKPLAEHFMEGLVTWEDKDLTPWAIPGGTPYLSGHTIGLKLPVGFPLPRRQSWNVTPTIDWCHKFNGGNVGLLQHLVDEGNNGIATEALFASKDHFDPLNFPPDKLIIDYTLGHEFVWWIIEWGDAPQLCDMTGCANTVILPAGPDEFCCCGAGAPASPPCCWTFQNSFGPGLCCGAQFGSGVSNGGYNLYRQDRCDGGSQIAELGAWVVTALPPPNGCMCKILATKSISWQVLDTPCTGNEEPC